MKDSKEPKMNQAAETLQKMGNAAPRLYVIATGAGAGIQDLIWKVPGISNFFIGAEMSYAPEKTEQALGFTPTKFVSVETAVDLALAAYMEAWKPGHRAIGLGLTASVCSTRPRRGEHQIIVAVFTESACYTMATVLEKGDFWERRDKGELTENELQECIQKQREFDGKMADHLGLHLLDLVVGAHVEKNEFSIGQLKTLVETGRVKENMEFAKQRILARPYFCADGTRKEESAIISNNTVFYPGAFNPPHEGHFKGATAALEVNNFQDVELVFSTTINPPHKTSLTPAEMLQRACMMKGHNFLLTENDPLYVDKAARFPGAHFIIGADALQRMLDSSWGVDCEELLNRFEQLKTHFLVLGRVVNGEYMIGSDILSNHMKAVGKEHAYWQRWILLVHTVFGFRLDISSTQLRNAQQ